MDHDDTAVGEAMFAAVKDALRTMPQALDRAHTFSDLPPVAQRRLIDAAHPLLRCGADQGTQQTLDKLQRCLVGNLTRDLAIAAWMGIDPGCLGMATIVIGDVPPAP